MNAEEEEDEEESEEEEEEDEEAEEDERDQHILDLIHDHLLGDATARFLAPPMAVDGLVKRVMKESSYSEEDVLSGIGGWVELKFMKSVHAIRFTVP